MLFSKSVLMAALMGLAAAKMHSSSVVASESLLASATGATGSLSTDSAGSSKGPSEAGTINTHVIQVGGPNGSLSFLPNNVKAQPGDLIQFQFHPKVCNESCCIMRRVANNE